MEKNRIKQLVFLIILGILLTISLYSLLSVSKLIGDVLPSIPYPLNQTVEVARNFFLYISIIIVIIAQVIGMLYIVIDMFQTK